MSKYHQGQSLRAYGRNLEILTTGRVIGCNDTVHHVRITQPDGGQLERRMTTRQITEWLAWASRPVMAPTRDA